MKTASQNILDLIKLFSTILISKFHYLEKSIIMQNFNKNTKIFCIKMKNIVELIEFQ